MVQCPRCGAEVPSDSAFCGKCGTRISIPVKSKPAMGFDLSPTKKIVIPLFAIVVVILLLYVFLGGDNPCKDVTCGAECHGMDLWQMRCFEGECIHDYMIESNSELCGIPQIEDPCKDVVCSDECFGTTLWKMRCSGGECRQASIIESNSVKCGYTPPTTPSPSPSPRPIILIEIYTVTYNAPGNDNDNPNGEWVEIRNSGNQDIDMSGWRLYDDAYKQGRARDHVFIFPSGFILRAGQSVRIHTGQGKNTTTQLYFGRAPGEYAAIWNNDGDCAYLVDNKGNLVDEYCWGR